MTVRRSATETGIPPYLIPQAIALQIHKRSESVCHINAKRVCLHHYRITARTKSPKREFNPAQVRVPPSRYEPVEHRDNVSHDHDSGGAP